MSELPDRGVIQLHPHHEPNLAFVKEKLEEMIALLRAIDGAEMLAALPECEVARGQHQAGLTLLRLMERELNSLFVAIA